jgi:HK97 family phage portal protein
MANLALDLLHPPGKLVGVDKTLGRGPLAIDLLHPPGKLVGVENALTRQQHETSLMRGFFQTFIDALRGKKSAPSSLLGGQWTGTSYVDSWKRTRNPTANELMAELKGVAWACASINAQVCATLPPALYVTTDEGQAPAKCGTKTVNHKTLQKLKARFPNQTQKATRIEEVTDHPLLTLFSSPNPVHSGFDLWELTALYLEFQGRAYWYLEMDPVLGMPIQIWPLPSQNVTARRRAGSQQLIDYYEYQTGTKRQEFSPDDIVFFRYPDPRDPYLCGISPLRACYEQVMLQSEFAATKAAMYENRGIPSALVSPDEVIGEEERDRLEAQWNTKFRRGGSGRVVVAESGMKLQLLQQSLGDLAALADMKATKEDIANAFHVPLSYLTSQTNLANLQAAQQQHQALAIVPRLCRRDEKLNHQLVRLFDPSGRLFLASDIDGATSAEQTWQQSATDLKFGVVTINEIRSDRGLPAVPWGNTPYAPLTPGQPAAEAEETASGGN